MDTCSFVSGKLKQILCWDWFPTTWPDLVHKHAKKELGQQSWTSTLSITHTYFCSIIQVLIPDQFLPFLSELLEVEKHSKVVVRNAEEGFQVIHSPCPGMLCIANLPVLSLVVFLTFYVCSHLYECFSGETADAINWSKCQNNKRCFSLQLGFCWWHIWN